MIPTAEPRFQAYFPDNRSTMPLLQTYEFGVLMKVLTTVGG